MQTDHQSRNDGRGEGTTQGEATVVQGLVDKIADSGSERPGENEGIPKKERARYVGPEISRPQRRQSAPEHERSSLISKARIGEPISESRSQCL